VALVLASSALVPAVAAECPDRLERLDMVEAAEQKLVEADLVGADLALRSLEKALGCGGLAESELLGRMWLVEGAWLTLQGDAQAATDSWQAAARVAPGRWVDAYGPELREAYEAAAREARVVGEPPTETARIELDPPLFQWIGALDGVVTQFPARVNPGLHVVQVGPNEDDMRFARVLVAFPSAPSVVVTGLVEPTNPFDVVDPAIVTGKRAQLRKAPLPPARVSLYTATGTDLALGRGVPAEGQGPGEPGVKVLLPLETGLVVRPGGRAMFRVAGTAGLLVGGKFLHDDRYGPTQTPTALGAHLVGGAWSGLGDMGLLVGYQWPDRIPVRGVVAGRLPRFPFLVEGRLGMNAAFGRTPEPAADVVFALVPSLWRRKAEE
jgi:hypothetical protein